MGFLDGTERLFLEIMSNSQLCGKGEGASHTRYAFSRYFPPHQRYDPLADTQPQPGPPIGAGEGAIPLSEGGKELGDLFRGKADAGVAHRNPEQEHPVPRAELFRRHGDADFSLSGEFDGIPQKDEQNLLQTLGVTHDCVRQLRFHHHPEFKPLFHAAYRYQPLDQVKSFA